MILSEEEAKKIINLNPSNSIDTDIANRQFQVILKGFNYLVQDDSDVLYIADEVGLGKTYIALGIASLLRHFTESSRHGSYKDVILVPKQNLQNKWFREINNFIKHNYLLECNIVKSVLGSPVANLSEKNIHHFLSGFDKECPSYEIYRNSSFSIATTEGFDWKLKLENTLPDELKPVFRKAYGIYKTSDLEIYLKRLYAFLLNISLPEMDLLIVDEAHNFKHGIGKDVSYRNQIVSRIMGVTLPEDDDYIFNHFPELKEKISQKAKKVILLSATPIDNGLYELKQQLDCFLPNHRFKNSVNLDEDIRTSLNTFMIRGLMKINLAQDGEVSRNMYRHEHRKGNVQKAIDAAPQYINDDLESIIIGLLQLKTLKHFNESNNKSFEIGMLAGFETFKTQDSDEPEFEDASIKANKAEDHDIIKKIANSYFDTFDNHLPHPKQDNLIRVLFEGIQKGHKSLVFVRRIASVIELERKLTIEIENWHLSKIKKYIRGNSRLKMLQSAFHERHQIAEIDEVLKRLSSKIFEYNKKDYEHLILEYTSNLELRLLEILLEIYNQENETIELDEFKGYVKDHIKLRIIKADFRELGKRLIDGYIENRQNNEDFEEDHTLDSTEDSFNYFFSSYFSSNRYTEGFNFRKRSATKDWYRFNNYCLKSKLSNLHFNPEKLVSFESIVRDNKTESRRMDAVNGSLFDSLTVSEVDNDLQIPDQFKKKTFFNLLIEEVLDKEFEQWLSKRSEDVLVGSDFWNDLEALIEIFQGIFRNGSGLLPAYVAESLDKDEFEKVLIDVLKASFPEVIAELKQILIDFDKIITTNFSNRNNIQRALYGQNPIVGVSGHHRRDVSRVATQFRMPGFPYVLFTTDVLKEGEDLHLYCKDVYHYGIAWNPSDMEQRTGRIDRINSSSYFQLKGDGKIQFSNALQVFYPYLADTLEVNQVAKVFNKMNKFIETFYDPTEIGDKDSKASIDEIVKEIPSQIKSLLSSKYDHETFQGVDITGKAEFEIVKEVGINRKYLSGKLRNAFELIQEHFNDFSSPPSLNDKRFFIDAPILLNGRRAPLRVSLVKGNKFDEVLFSIQSIICRNTELRNRRIRDEIRFQLKHLSLNLVENNDYLLVQNTYPMETEANELIRAIRDIIQKADNLEEEYLGEDLEV
ncbi:SNF2-related protein [Mangrovimonas xylaniphaga]|uniref:SNF2-related protein n=1 Tax=Mangrovimonas xylaniphaga TaxID=1645915 RepID=UPI0006B57818|nr:SNF2-related protein [Mangrovimonas xylaniphaga]